MKNFSNFIIIILVCFALSAFSQSSEKYSIGVIGGLHISDMYFENNQGANDQEISSLTQFGLGALIDIRLSPKSSIYLEPMYLQKGGKIEEGSDPANQPPGEITTAYLELPILFKYTFGEKIMPYVVVGPSVGYLLSSELVFEISGYNFTGDFSDVMESFDLGVTIGGGLQYPVSFGLLFIEAKYNYGLINQMKGGTVTLESNGIEVDLTLDKEMDKFINRGFQILAGASFPL